MIFDLVSDGVVRQRYNDDTQTYTAFDESGNVTEGPRPYTAEETAAATARTTNQGNIVTEATLEDRVRTTYNNNLTWLNRTVTPTNAQTLTQIDRLTRQVNALMKIILKDYSNTDGT